MNQTVQGIITILTAIVGVAILAVLVSKNANTADVIKSGSDGFAKILASAVSPVVGNGGGFVSSF